MTLFWGKPREAQRLVTSSPPTPRLPHSTNGPVPLPAMLGTVLSGDTSVSQQCPYVLDACGKLVRS